MATQTVLYYEGQNIESLSKEQVVEIAKKLHAENESFRRDITNRRLRMFDVMGRPSNLIKGNQNGSRR